jgi:SulP family sulfate permease
LELKISGEKFSEIFMQLIKEAGNIHIPTLIIGVASVILLLLVKRVNKKIPGPLVVVLLGIIVVYLGSLTNQGVKIVGDIPGGLPSFHMFSMNWDSIQTLLPTAFTIAFVGFMESIAVAKAIQARHKDYKLDANQELKALGIANIAGSFFKSFPVTGGFSRTAVNDQAGAKTGFASIISASLIIITLLFLTSYFYYLPNAVLAAIIIVAVYGLIDFKEARYLWKTDRTDFFLFISAAIGTLVLGIEEGIILGVILSLALLIFRVSYPHYSQLGLINNGREFINVLRDKNAKIDNKIVIMRFDAQLFFANINYFKEKVELLIGERKQPEFFYT